MYGILFIIVKRTNEKQLNLNICKLNIVLLKNYFIGGDKKLFWTFTRPSHTDFSAVACTVCSKSYHIISIHAQLLNHITTTALEQSTYQITNHFFNEIFNKYCVINKNMNMQSVLLCPEYNLDIFPY